MEMLLWLHGSNTSQCCARAAVAPQLTSPPCIGRLSLEGDVLKSRADHRREPVFGQCSPSRPAGTAACELDAGPKATFSRPPAIYGLTVTADALSLDGTRARVYHHPCQNIQIRGPS